MVFCWKKAVWRNYKKRTAGISFRRFRRIPESGYTFGQQQFAVEAYSVEDDHSWRLYDTSLDMAAINKALVLQGVAVISASLRNDTLEDYFKKITGGEGIA